MAGADAVGLTSLAKPTCMVHTEGIHCSWSTCRTIPVARGILIVERENGWTTRDGIDAASLKLAVQHRRTHRARAPST